MAFKKDNSNSNTGGIPEHKKAQGYLNIYLPAKAGGGARRKLGAIPLRQANTGEMELATWLAADPARIEILLSKLELEYNPAESPNPGFDLSE